MPAQRLKGQEVTILVTRDGNYEDSITDVQNFNLEFQLEVKSQGYLGEKTNRKDSLFNGAKFDCEVHMHSQAWLSFLKAMIDKAKRVAPDIVFNITSVFAFPNGDTPTIMLPDCSFGAVPIKIGSRGDYVSWKLEGEVGDADIALS